MPYKNGKYYSLRDVQQKVNSEIYEQLSEKALIEICYLANGALDKSTDLHALKSALTINFEAMAKVIDKLMVNNWIEIVPGKGISQKELMSSDFLISLTEQGRTTAINFMHRAYSRK